MVAVALAAALVVKLAVTAVELVVAVQNVPSVGKALWSLLAKGTTDRKVPSVGKALWPLLAKGTTEQGKAKGTTATTMFIAQALWSLWRKGTTERDHNNQGGHT